MLGATLFVAGAADDDRVASLAELARHGNGGSVIPEQKDLVRFGRCGDHVDITGNCGELVAARDGVRLDIVRRKASALAA